MLGEVHGRVGALEEPHEVLLLGERPVAVAGAQPVGDARPRERGDQVPPERPHRRLDPSPSREVEEVGLEELLALAEGDDFGLERRAERQDERDRAPGAGEMARDRVAGEGRAQPEGDPSRAVRGDMEQPEPGGGLDQLARAAPRRFEASSSIARPRPPAALRRKCSEVKV